MKMPESIVFLEPKGAMLEVVRAAKERGYHTIGLCSDPSFLPNTPSAYRALTVHLDCVVPVPAWDEGASWQGLWQDLRKQAHVVGVFTGMDACVEICARMRQDLQLPSTSPATWAMVTHKAALRRYLRQAGLSQLATMTPEELSVAGQWPFPGAAYVKPVRGSFSLYVKRCETSESAARAVAAFSEGLRAEQGYMANYMRRDAVPFLEEAIEGELLSVEAISQGGNFSSLGLLSRILLSEDHTIEMGSCFPYPHPREKEIVALVARAHAVLGITDGASHTEVIVASDGRIEIIDLNPRIVGADVLMSLNRAYGVDFAHILLDLALGKTVSLPDATHRYCCLQYVIPPADIVFDTISYPQDDSVTFTNTYLRPGTRTQALARQVDYAGCYLVESDSFESALQRSRHLRDHVTINQQGKGRY